MKRCVWYGLVAGWNGGMVVVNLISFRVSLVTFGSFLMCAVFLYLLSLQEPPPP